MNAITASLFALVCFAQLFTTASAGVCLPINFQQGFDLAWFTQSSWFIQQMKPSRLFPFDNRFCSVMTFDSTRVLSKRKERFIANLYAKVNIQSGVNAIQSYRPLCLTRPEQTIPSQLTLGSCLLATEVSRDFFIVAYNEGGALGDWVVAVEGQPSVPLTGTCSTAGICGMKPDEGIYIMTRQSNANSNVLAAAYAAATAAGVCMNQVIDVEQSGCNYLGAVIKT